MLNFTGGILTFNGGWQMVNTSSRTARQLNIRMPTGGTTISISADAIMVCGFLKAEESRQFLNTSPSSVYVRGTSGESLYWDMSE